VSGTERLIDALVARAAPVRRLRSPWLRALQWLALAAVVLAFMALVHGVRSDLTEHLRQGGFLMGLGAALATGMLAAIAAFMISLPDRSPWWMLLPMPTLAIWVSSIGYGCLTDWVNVGPDGVQLGETARCFATLLLTSVPLAIAMAAMLRYAVLLRANTVTFLGTLAVAAMTAFALSLDHDLDASAMILIWNIGVAALITGIGSLLGRRSLLLVA
jgi:hypothetical protein